MDEDAKLVEVTTHRIMCVCECDKITARNEVKSILEFFETESMRIIRERMDNYKQRIEEMRHVH